MASTVAFIEGHVIGKTWIYPPTDPPCLKNNNTNEDMGIDGRTDKYSPVWSEGKIYSW